VSLASLVTQAGDLRGTTLLCRDLAITASAGANTPRPYNGSSRRRLRLSGFTDTAHEGASESHTH